MDRRVVLILAAICLVFTVSACGRKTVKEEPKPVEVAAKEDAKAPEAKGAAEATLPPVAAAPAESPKAPEPPPPPPKTPLEILGEAKVDYGAKKYTDALAKVVEVRKALPENAEALELLARLRFELGQKEEAINALEEMVSKGLGSIEAVHTYVNMAAQEKLYARAVATLEKRGAIKTEPELTGAIGWLWYKAGDTKKALDAFTAIENTPVYAKYSIFAGRIKLATGDTAGAKAASLKATGSGEAAALVVADAERAEGHASAAEEDYRAILKRSPNDYGARVNLGVLKLGQGENKAAAQFFEEAANARPEMPEAWNDLGLAKRATGDHAGAEKAYRQALSVEADYPPALKNLAILMEKYLGKPAEALPLYTRYLKVSPGDKDVERWQKAAQRSAEEAK